MLDNLPKSTLKKIINHYNEDAAKEQKKAPKREVKLYLAIQQWSDGDGWESGDAGANILYATLSKSKMDAYVANIKNNFHFEPTLVTIDLDTDYLDYVDRGTKTQVASWFENYDDYYDYDD